MDESAATPQDEPPIGRAGAPVRAFVFGGGGFDTAMQLGVAHALLVIHGRAPDVVVGLSAGAINAAALADILQHGAPVPPPPPTTDPAELQRRHERRMEARVRRFRQFLDAFKRTPSELLGELLPDAYQIEGQQPLDPVRQPTHARAERRHREEELQSRAGLINLYNELLQVRIPVSTVTRFVRRLLGLRAALALRGPDRWGAFAVELVQLWTLAGTNLARLAPLASVLVPPLVADRRWSSRGATAGEILFRSRLLAAALHAVRHGAWFLVLALTWLTATVAVLVLPMAAWWALRAVVPALPRVEGVDGGLVFYLVLLVPLVVWLLVRGWGRAAVSVRTVVEVVLRIVVLLLSVAAGIVVLRLVLGLPGQWPAITAAAGALDAGALVRALWAAVRGAGKSSWALFWWSLALLVAGILWIRAMGRYRDYLRRLLDRYALADGLFQANALRQRFVTLFDPGYYGQTNLDQALDRALRNDPRPADRTARPRPLDDFRRGDPPVIVGISAAEVATGRLAVVPQQTPVVDALLAATARTPFFPANPAVQPLLVDAAVVTNEPMRGLFALLRRRVHPEASVIHTYTVSPLPVSRGEAPAPGGKEYLSLVEITLRALQLQKFRDATLERRLTHLYTRAMPPGRAIFPVREPTGETKGYARIWLTPIEPGASLDVTERLTAATSPEARQAIIAETVADGCRAALEVMVRPSIGQAGEKRVTSLPCRAAVAAHIKARSSYFPDGLTAEQEAVADLPGSSRRSEEGPGLPEVCRHCAMARGTGAEQRATLEIRPWATVGLPWPHELEEDARRAEEDAARDDPRYTYDMPGEADGRAALLAMHRETGWPPRGGGQRPLTSVLFSGGVFRGVYQVGVLNALDALRLTPDIVAGASVGSITAAAVARVFGEPDADLRQRRIIRLAATYLAIDRLILTDRFADFVRGFTLRAGSARFSLYRADRVLRRFDAARSGTFERELRDLVAGLERLFYVSPFEFYDLLRAFRAGNAAEAGAQLRARVQEWLDRMGVGLEVLGTEPLSFIIAEHILAGLGQPVPFDVFARGGERAIYLLATTTNLTRGRLTILGERPRGRAESRTLLLQGLLASSAFPGVFRPRRAWELRPGAVEDEQFIDGGVMDNLPLDAVAQFLFGAARAGFVSPRPLVDGRPVPHLLVAASLEVSEPELPESVVAPLAGDWPALRRRARRLRYNQKVAVFQQAQRELRSIWGALSPADRAAMFSFGEGPPVPGADPARIPPLDLEVLPIVPRWLCGTFAFHPMLGFRREKQAASIAHGCASTLVQFGIATRGAPADRWAPAWGLDGTVLPSPEALARPEPYAPLPGAARERGDCWLRPGHRCPFSRANLERLNRAAAADARWSDATIGEVAAIHLACRDVNRAHRPPPAR